MNNISHPNLLNTKKNTMTYVVGNPGPGLGQTQKSVLSKTNVPTFIDITFFFPGWRFTEQTCIS
jgi:hypothetical protein